MKPFVLITTQLSPPFIFRIV